MASNSAANKLLTLVGLSLETPADSIDTDGAHVRRALDVAANAGSVVVSQLLLIRHANGEFAVPDLHHPYAWCVERLKSVALLLLAPEVVNKRLAAALLPTVRAGLMALLRRRWYNLQSLHRDPRFEWPEPTGVSANNRVRSSCERITALLKASSAAFDGLLKSVWHMVSRHDFSNVIEIAFTYLHKVVEEAELLSAERASMEKEFMRLREKWDAKVEIADDVDASRELRALQRAAAHYNDVHTGRHNALTELSRELSACVNVSLDVLRARRLSTTLSLDRVLEGSACRWDELGRISNKDARFRDYLWAVVCDVHPAPHQPLSLPTVPAQFVKLLHPSEPTTRLLAPLVDMGSDLSALDTAIRAVRTFVDAQFAHEAAALVFCSYSVARCCTDTDAGQSIVARLGDECGVSAAVCQLVELCARVDGGEDPNALARPLSLTAAAWSTFEGTTSVLAKNAPVVYRSLDSLVRDGGIAVATVAADVPAPISVMPCVAGEVSVDAKAAVVNGFLAKDLLGIAYDKADALSPETTGASLTHLFSTVLQSKDKKKRMLGLPKNDFQRFVFERALLLEPDQQATEGRHLVALSRLASHLPYYSPLPILRDATAAVPRSCIGFEAITPAQARQALLIPGTATASSVASLMDFQDTVLKDSTPLATQYGKFVPASLSRGLAAWQACQGQIDAGDAEVVDENGIDDVGMDDNHDGTDEGTLLMSPFSPQYLAGYLSQVKHTTPRPSSRPPRTTTDPRRMPASSAKRLRVPVAPADAYVPSPIPFASSARIAARMTGTPGGGVPEPGVFVATPIAGRMDSSPFLSPNDSAPFSLGALTGSRPAAPPVFQEPPKNLLRRFGASAAPSVNASGLNASVGSASIARPDAPPQFFKPPTTPGLISPATTRQLLPPAHRDAEESIPIAQRHQDQAFRQPPRSRLTFGLRPLVPK